MMANFFIMYYLENLVPALDPIYLTFNKVMTAPVQTYMCLIFSTCLVFSPEMLIKYIKEYFVRPDVKVNNKEVYKPFIHNY
jgi:hypothetical protein